MERMELGDGRWFGVNHCRGARLPVLFNFCATAGAGLDDPWYGRIAMLAGAENWRCVSIDLPCHDAEAEASGKPYDPLRQWREAMAAGRDIVGEITSLGQAALDHLAARGLADPECVAAFGTSRGGFAAAHFAAVEPRVGYVMLLAPVTELLRLREFAGTETSGFIRGFALQRPEYLAALCNRRVWGWIGANDERVDTDAAVEFFRGLSRRAAAGGDFAACDFTVAAVEGHTSRTDCHDLAAAWLWRQVAHRPCRSGCRP